MYRISLYIHSKAGKPVCNTVYNTIKVNPCTQYLCTYTIKLGKPVCNTVYDTIKKLIYIHNISVNIH